MTDDSSTAAGQAQRSLKDEIEELKRARVLEAATKLFLSHGYVGTSLDAIAQLAGVHKPVIYNHFGNKADLLATVARRGLCGAFECATALKARSGTPTQRMQAFLRDFARSVIQNRASLAIYFREEMQLPEDSVEAQSLLRAEFDAIVNEVIQEGVRAGEFSVKDTGLATLGIGGLMTWMFLWYKPTGRLSEDEVVECMTDLGLQMIQGKRADAAR